MPPNQENGPDLIPLVADPPVELPNLQLSAAPFSPSIFIIAAITLYITGSLSCPVIQLLLRVTSV